MISGLNPSDTMQGILQTKNKALNVPNYEFHPYLHEVLSIAFTEFNLHVLSGDQEKLIREYLIAADDTHAINSNDLLFQLDQYLGSLTNELYHECKYLGSVSRITREDRKATGRENSPCIITG